MDISNGDHTTMHNGVPPDALVRSGVLERVDNVKRDIGRSKQIWYESVKRDINDWNISKSIVLDRSA